MFSKSPLQIQRSLFADDQLASMGWVGGAKISASFLRRIKLLRFLSRIVPLFLLPHHQNFGDLGLVAGQKVKKAAHLGLLGVINRATGNLVLACAKLYFLSQV